VFCDNSFCCRLKGIQVINQKLTELELSLFNIKQNVQIDEVHLEFNPEVLEASRKVSPCSPIS
jgi:hypothetical protein